MLARYKQKSSGFASCQKTLGDGATNHEVWARGSARGIHVAWEASVVAPMWSPSELQAASSLRIKLSLRQELAQADSLAKVVSWDLDELTPNFGSAVGFLHGLGQITTSQCSLSLQTESSLFSPTVYSEHKHLGMDCSFFRLACTVPIRG